MTNPTFPGNSGTGSNTQTIPLLPGSYAFDRGYPSTSNATDQRGMPRVGSRDQFFTLIGGEPHTPHYYLLWNACAEINHAEIACLNGGRDVSWIIVDTLLADLRLLMQCYTWIMVSIQLILSTT